MEEPVSEVPGEQTEPAQDDNETPVIEPETPSEETPEVPEETPSEPVEEDPTETPEETADPEEPAVVVEEPEEELPEFTTNSFDDVIMATAPITFKFTVNGEESTDAALASYVTDKTNITDGNVSAENDVTFKVTIPADVELVLAETNPVQASIDSGTATALTKDAESGVYTVAGSKAASTGVEVTIAFVDKTYSVAAPTNTSDVTWKIKLDGGSSYDTAAVQVKKGGSVKLEATKAGADDVKVTVAGATEAAQTLTTSKTTAEFTVVVDAERLAALESGKLTAEYEVNKAAVEVLVKGFKGDDGTTAADYGTDFTAQYRVQGTTAGKFGEWNAVAAGKIAAKKDDVIQLKITPVNFSVSGVTFGTSETVISAIDADGEDVYQITAQAPANPVAAENTVKVTLAAANKVTLKADTDAQIEKVEWATTASPSDWNRTRKTADGWVADTKSETVYFQVTAKTNHKVVSVKNGSTALTLDPAAGGAVVKTATAVDASTASVELTITTERIKVDYTLTADGGLTVTIKDDKGTAVKAKGTTGEDAKKYTLLDGADYTVEVKQGETAVDLAKLQTATAGGTAMDYDGDKDAFVFAADEDDDPKTIVIELKAKGNNKVSLTMADATLAVATVKADAHKKIDGGTSTDVTADAAAIDLSTTAQEYDVEEGTDFSFTLAAKDADNYVITKVETSTDAGTTWTDLEGTEGKYTLKAVSAATSVRVTTALDETKAYSITFKAAAENVKSIAMDLAGGADPATAVKVGDTYYLKAAANAKVTFKVTTFDGYAIDKVAYGTGETDILTASGTTYTYDKFAADKKTAEITVSTKAATLGSDRFVRIDMPASSVPNADKIELNVTTEGVKTEKVDEKDVYVLTKEVKDGETVTTPAVPELAFDLVVENGYTIKPQIASITAADSEKETVRATLASRKKGEDGRWVYSFKVVASALEAASVGAAKATPKVITVAVPDVEKVTIKADAASETVQYKNLSSDSSFSALAADATKAVDDGDTIVLKAAGMSLSVGDKDMTKEMDEEGNYSFVAALDPTKDNDTTITVKAEAPAAAAYELRYADTAAGAATGTVVGKDAIPAKLGAKIYVQLKNITEDEAEKIVGVTLSENAKSTAVPDADQDTNTGKAVITVADADVTVTFKAIKTEAVGTITKKTVVNAATIHIVAKDANGTTLTAKGITNKKTIKIDATKKMTYPLTLKSGKTVLDVKQYTTDGALQVTSSKEALVKAAFDGDGNLVITALNDKDGENKAVSDITITAKGAAAEANPLLTFKVEVQKPKLAVKTFDSPNQGMQDLLINVAADAKIGTVATDDFDLYYEIDVKHKEGSSAAKKDGVYYFDALDGNGSIVSVSQLIKVNNDAADKCENAYTVTAKLVAVAAGAAVSAGSPTEGTSGTKLTDAAVKYASEKTVEKVIKTRPGNYEEKLGVTKKTTKLYTGQSGVVVAIPKFSAKAGHIDDIFAQVYNTDGSIATAVTATVDNTDTMEVKVNVGNTAAPGKGTAKYNVVIYATATKNAGDAAVDPGAYNMYRASAKVPITVQKGIHHITVDGNPGKIALVADNKGKVKDVSFSLKPTGWDNSNFYKAQTQKFEYTVKSYTNPAKNAGKVTVKNGKVTVSKDFYVSNDPANNKFTINVKANDWAGNTTNQDVVVEVTNKAMEISSVRLVRSNGKPYDAKINADDLSGAKVEVLDGNNKKIDAKYVTLTPNKGKIYVNAVGTLVQDGYQKNLTITAVAKDGKKAKKSSIKYTIDYPSVGSYTLANVSVHTGYSEENNTLKRVSETAWEYVGNGNNKIDFAVNAVIDDSLCGGNVAEYNYSVNIKGGKNTSAKTGDYGTDNGYYSITPTAEEVVVTVTDKASKPAKPPYQFKIKDKKWATGKVPSAATKDKLFLAYDATTGYKVPQTMTYTIKNCKYNAVKITHVGGSVSGISNVEGVKDISPAGELILANITPSAATTEKYAVVYGNKDADGIFTPDTKAGNLTIKVNKVGTIKAVNKYTISTNLSYGVKLDAKPLPGKVGLLQAVKFRSIEAANVKGQPNQFYEYFELVASEADGPKDTIQVKAKYQNADGLAKIAALAKTDFNGYLTYDVYGPNNTKITKQDKITLVVNDNGKPKATATDINIVGTNAASAFTTVKVGSTAVNVLAVVTDSANYNVAKATDAEVEAGSGNIKVTAKAAPVTETVNLYILPVGSRYPANATADVIKEKGIKAAVKVNVKDATDTKSSKITFLSKNAKTPDDVSIVEKKVNLSTTFALGTDYKYTLSNAEIATVAKVPAAKEADVKNADSKAAMQATLSVAINPAKTEITLVLDRDGLDQKGKKTYQVPVFVTFTAGEPEIVYFPIKPKAVPTVDNVKAEIEKNLANLPVTAYNGAGGTAAATEVQTAARALGTTVVDPLSGVDVNKITVAPKVVGNQKFEDDGAEGTDGFKEGHHTVVVTFDDETKKGSEGYAATTLDVKVSEKAAPVSLGASLTEAINVYLLANPSTGAAPAEPAKEMPTTMTAYTMQSELQAAADKAAPDKYIVRVPKDNFVIATDDATVPAAPASINADAGTKKTIVTSMSFDYSVMVAKTGKYLNDDGDEVEDEYLFNVVMSDTSNTAPAPADPTPVTPTPDPGPTSFKVTVTGAENSTVTYKTVTANDAAPEATAITTALPADGKVSVQSGEKLYLKVVWNDGTVVVKKGTDTTIAETGNTGVYEIGAITEATTVTIEETLTNNEDQ